MARKKKQWNAYGKKTHEKLDFLNVVTLSNPYVILNGNLLTYFLYRTTALEEL